MGFLRATRSAAGFRELGCKVWDQNANENAQWLANPYRDGTTHTATLTFANRSGGGVRCLEFWGASLGPYSWHPKKEPPWGTTSVTGKLHIIDSQHISEGDPFVHGAAATFTARGRTIDLSGGKRPRWSTLPCSNYSS